MSDIVERLREHYARSYEETAPGEVIARYRDERTEAVDEIERLRAENQRYDLRLKESHDIVARIWAIFGNPSYADLKGSSIYDLITGLQAENAKLREAVVDCARDLECAINADFPADVRVQYPVMQDKYESEMTTVYEARKALAKASS